MVASCSVKEALDNYHEVRVTDENGKELTEVANKYYVMYGDMARSSMSVDELRLGIVVSLPSLSPLSIPLLPQTQCGFYGNQIPSRWAPVTAC